MRLGPGFLIRLAVQSALALASAAAVAQQAAPAGGGLEEVTVTAQRRTENLQDVPLAVTSFSAEALNAQQITSALDVARAVPNFIASNNVGQASANVYYIRGLGQTQSFPTFEPQVGTYVDDIYIGRQNANNLALFGIDQLQVLRGPQGTLFGRNSTGGAVVVTLQKPGRELGGDVEAAYGAYDRFFWRGSVDVPITDALRTRTSAFGVRDDGYVQNLTTGEKLNKTKNWGVREAIELAPEGARASWSLSFDLVDNDAANVLNQPDLGGSLHGSGRASYSGFSIHGGALEPFLTGQKGTLGQGVDVRTWGAMSNIRVAFDAGVLNIITGYRGLRQLTAVDFPLLAFGPAVPFDQTPYGQFTLAQRLKTSQYSQEVKWTGEAAHLTYTLGAFYLDEKNTNDFGAVANLGPLFGLTSLPFPLGDETTVNKTRSGAVYAQGDFKLTDALTLTVGGRFTHEKKTLTAAPNGATGFTTADIEAAGWKTDLSVNEFTPRVSLQYKVSPQVMVYGSATRGFQGGGWNGLAFNAQTFNNFNPETVWSYELGLRSETADRRVRLNLNAFYENVKDYQLLSDNAAAGSFVTTNAADLHAYGLEMELAWVPVDRLTVLLNGGLMQAKYRNPGEIVVAQQQACLANPGPTNGSCGAGIVDANGNLATPSYTPHANASLHATYDLNLGTTVVTPSIGVQWTGKENVGTEGSPLGENKPFTLLDFALAVKPNNGPLTITAECKNCTKKDYATAYLFGYRYYNVPGTWDVRVGYKF